MRSLPLPAVCALLSLVLTAGVAVARTAPAQTPATMPATTKPVTLSATIEAIDKSTRMITLKGPQGNLATVYADSSVKRFDELKVGDAVKATYYESIAVNVHQPGRPCATRVGRGRLPQPVAARCHRLGAGDGDGHRHLGRSSQSRGHAQAPGQLNRQHARREPAVLWTWQSPAPRWTSPTRRRC